MTTNLKNKLLFLVLAASLLSCKKNIPGVTKPDQYSGADLNSVFEAYWTGMNNNYAFWDIDTTNWDNVYHVYQPLFASLNIHDSQDVVKAYNYFKSMTSGLIDCHYNLSFTNAFLKKLPSISPANLRKPNIAPALPFSFFSVTIKKKYFDTGFACYSPYQVTFGGTKYTSYMGMVTGIINQHIVYLHINQFALRSLIEQRYDSLTKGWNMFLSNINNPAIATKGVIIDMRSNSGGYLDDLNFICGSITDKRLLFAYTREKSGNGRLDYTPWAPAYVIPNTGAKAVTVPIVVLTDQRSISMAEMTTMALKTMPNTYIIGDTTFGANGPLSDDVDLFNGGQFHFANFGFAYTASAVYKYRDGNIYEGKGFPPDKYIPYNKTAVAAGTDLQLEAAIEYLK